MTASGLDMLDINLSTLVLKSDFTDETLSVEFLDMCLFSKPSLWFSLSVAHVYAGSFYFELTWLQAISYIFSQHSLDINI